MKGRDILFGELNSDLLMEYEAYLKNRGNSPNTISFYMRILKAVYNRAVENGLTGQNLFKSVYTGVEKTLKRAIHLNDIRRIKKNEEHQSHCSIRTRWKCTLPNRSSSRRRQSLDAV